MYVEETNTVFDESSKSFCTYYNHLIQTSKYISISEGPHCSIVFCGYVFTERLLTSDKNLDFVLGIFTVAGLVDSFIYYGQRAIRKMEAGKFG